MREASRYHLDCEPDGPYDMDQKLRDDECWTKRFSSRSLEITHIQRLQSLPAFALRSETDETFQTLLDRLAQAEVMQTTT